MSLPAFIHKFHPRGEWLSKLLAALLALLLIGCAMQLVEAAVPIPTRPIHTNKPRFRIPFRYDPAELERMSATQIQLFVSDDEGIKWRKNQTVAPEAGRFSFMAPADGQYWFAVRTLSADGSLTPAGDHFEPGLKVIVDTTPPELHLALRETRPGWVQLTWNTVDDNLDPTTLRLQYKQGNDLKWKPLSIVPMADGQTQWSLPPGGNVAVRGTVEDYSDNSGRGNVQTSIRPATDIVPKPNVPNFNQPVATNHHRSRSNGSMQIPQKFPTSPGTGETQFRTVKPHTSPEAGFQEVPGRTPLTPKTVTPQQQEEFVSSQQSLESRWKEESVPQESETSPPQNGEDVPFRFVNSYEFNIGYKIDDIGPSGVSAVEVFITQDNGDSWWKYGSDNDRKSPVRVKVPKEGRYGLAMRVRSGVGLASDPPQAGDRADIEVIVDTTPPSLRLLPLEQGQGVANNQILIQWDVSDQNLGNEPITLFYGGTAQGPWHPIAGTHRNTGRYMWKVGQGVPSKLYIRIQAQDAAGNLQTAATDYPVLVDLSRPRARIVDIEPESAGGRR